MLSLFAIAASRRERRASEEEPAVPHTGVLSERGPGHRGMLHDEIVKRAVLALEIPLAGENLEIMRDGPRTSVKASYTQPVECWHA